MKRTILLVGVAVLLIGCGSSDEGSDEDQVREQMGTWLAAVADDDEEACEVMAPETLEGLQETYESPSCVVLTIGPAVALEGVDLDSLSVDRVDIEGDSATVGIEGDSSTFEFEKIDGEWKMTELPGI